MLWRAIVLGVLWAGAALAQERHPLDGAASPYLQLHRDDPVKWYPWGPEALRLAAETGRPIFVSVGYASCHWCHVMQAESFRDARTADALNAGFVAVKIDRESRPDLDRQFMTVTRLMAGSAGWPNSVFLTPDGDPFFAGGYFPREDFRAVLWQVAGAWRDDPDGIAEQARGVSASVREVLTGLAAAQPVTSGAMQAAVAEILDELDPFHGGFGVAPKFPRAPIFLFLQSEAVRRSDDAAQQAVVDMLDGMLGGGIHDALGGGFHRYAVDPQWQVPHFEKMLYNQALNARLLLRAWVATGEMRYRSAAEATLDFTLREMRAPGGGFHASLDAVSLDESGARVEGAYYTWTPENLAPLGPEAGFAAETLGIDAAGDVEGDLPGANIVVLPEQVSPRLAQVVAQMRRLRAERAPPLRDRKILTAWNAEMIRTLAEAGQRLDRPDYLRAAEEAAGFVLDALRPAEGLRRVWYEGRATEPAQLDDHAALGLALVALSDARWGAADAGTDPEIWLTTAQAIAQEIPARFGGVEGGLRMTQRVEGMTEIIPRDDETLPSGNALALMLYARLNRRLRDPALAQDGAVLAAALSGTGLSAPVHRAGTLQALQLWHDGPVGAAQVMAHGAVRADLRHGVAPGTAVLTLEIREGWHVNSAAPLEPHLIPTQVALPGGAVGAPVYPEGLVKALGFNAAALSLFEGRVEIVLKGLPVAGSERVAVMLALQACSDTLCLPPEDAHLTLWPRGR